MKKRMRITIRCGCGRCVVDSNGSIKDSLHAMIKGLVAVFAMHSKPDAQIEQFAELVKKEIIRFYRNNF